MYVAATDLLISKQLTYSVSVKDTFLCVGACEGMVWRMKKWFRDLVDVRVQTQASCAIWDALASSCHLGDV